MKKKLLRINFVLLGFLTFFVSQSFAINYYVDPSSTSTTANGTLLYPWKTISQVNAGTTALNPGDTVFFKRGQTYSGRLTVGRSGTASSPIVYTNYGTGTLPEFNNSVSGIINLSGRQYVIIDGIKIVDNSISETDHTVQAKISYAINIDNSPNCTIRNCDISRVGVGISVTNGSDYTTITGNYMHNMRMVRNTPTTVNSNDDYGANPMVIGSSNNIISNNRFEECWALSYDYGYDGGAVELFGSTMNNNKIMYNTAINCNGFMEIGSSTNGSALNNIIAYNKIINCGIIGVYQNASTFMVTVNNLQYYNNTVIETVKQYSKPSAMFWMAGTGTAGMVTLKNNIFWLSSGVNFVGSKFSSGQIIHTNNIYRMSSGTLGYTLNSNELLSSTANHFQSTSGDPSAWNYNLLSTSPAINFGTAVGFTKDFLGNSIVGNPDAGMLEANTTPVVVSPLVATASAGTINCNGGTTSVLVSATGGTTPYTGTGSFTVSAGTYNYIVSDAAGLKDTVPVTITQPALITSSLSAGTISVNGGTTSITVTAGGGTSPYTYSLNGGTYQTSNIFSNLVSGTHTVVVKDAKGCTLSKNIGITEPSIFNISATAGTINCSGGTTSVEVSATGGTIPYTGIGTFTVSAGTYNYIVSDAAGLKDTVSVTIAEPVQINSSLTAGTISVNGGTTSITVIAEGGTSPYTYSLNGGTYQTSNFFSGVVAGTHTVIVKDTKGCTLSKSIVITQPSAFIASVSAGTINCNGGTTAVMVSAVGGTTPYTGTGTFTVSAGTYNYIVSDATGLKDTVSVSIVQPAQITSSLSAGTISVNGGKTSITVTAGGGTSPYTYSLNGGVYQTSNVFSGVVAGTHSVVVKDTKACTLSKSIVITQPSIFVASASAGTINCNGGTTSVVVSAIGGITPYTGIGTFTVSAGSYNYVVSDASGTKDTVSVIVSQPLKLDAVVTAAPISVYGGTTDLTVNASGGTAPYSYSLNNGIYQLSNIFSSVLSGTYSISSKDKNGCIVTKSITVTQPAYVAKPDPLIASVNAGQIACNGGSTTVVVSAVGGVQPYVGVGSYTVGAGTYNYIVTDASGQKDTATLTLTQPSELKASVSSGTISVAGGTTSITVAASGGAYPYNYALDGGLFQSSNIFNNVYAGSHVIVTQDFNGCSVSNNMTISDYVLTSSTSVKFNIKVYPNPSTNYFTLTVSNYHKSFPAYLRVFDGFSNLVYFAQGTSYSSFVFGSNFIAGTYYARVTVGATSKTVKVIKL